MAVPSDATRRVFNSPPIAYSIHIPLVPQRFLQQHHTIKCEQYKADQWCASQGLGLGIARHISGYYSHVKLGNSEPESLHHEAYLWATTHM
jgi:hypothetical protein